VTRGVSPLYENEGLKVGRIPPMTPIDQVRDEGNRYVRGWIGYFGLARQFDEFVN
jgi:hypothetical protein